MEENKKNLPLILGIILVILLIVVGGGLYYLNSLKTKNSSKTSSSVYPAPTAGQKMENTQLPPTLSPEEKEIIANLQTHEVKIENGKLNPETLTIKLHDQVMWVNNDTKPHKIAGENWGGVPIQPGESFTQAFDQKGTFSYSCALQPDLKGTIIVE